MGASVLAAWLTFLTWLLSMVGAEINSNEKICRCLRSEIKTGDLGTQRVGKNPWKEKNVDDSPSEMGI